MRFPVIQHDNMLRANMTLDVAAQSPLRFHDVGDDALEYLRREGYVVISNVLNETDLSHARDDLLWAFLEGMQTGVRRNQPDTHVLSQPNQYGIVWTHGVGHSRLAWFIRTRPKLRSLFEAFWETEDLITSFEGFSFLPPLKDETRWRVGVGWFHTDQNARSRPGLQTIQSLTSLYDQDETTGGFVVVPRSWKRHGQVTDRIYQGRRPPAAETQFLMIPEDDPILYKPRKPRLLRVKAGDSIFWDSRTVHCSTPAQQKAALDAVSEGDDRMMRPLRVAVYGTAVPRSRASDAILRARQQAARQGQTCTHWPFEMSCLEPPHKMGQVASDQQAVFGPIETRLIGRTDEQIARDAVKEEL